jgi:hypothetical protein
MLFHLSDIDFQWLTVKELSIKCDRIVFLVINNTLSFQIMFNAKYMFLLECLRIWYLISWRLALHIDFIQGLLI